MRPLPVLRGGSFKIMRSKCKFWHKRVSFWWSFGEASPCAEVWWLQDHEIQVQNLAQACLFLVKFW